MFKEKIIILFVLLLTYSKSFAICKIIDAKDNDDLLISIMSSVQSCPKNVLSLKALFSADGLKSNPSLVANRGYHNPQYGSFSIFETLTGISKGYKKVIKAEHLYFGHFTGKDLSNTIVLDQNNSQGKLLVELIAYDFKKKVYNFYELIGDPSGPKWFYRGDSYDAFSDNKALKIQGTEQKRPKMRCSACHNAGGPIMKELDFPHLDWWTAKNKIKFGNARLSTDLEEYINTFVDASQFSKSVKDGILLLEQAQLAESLSIKEQLRPLFCTTEINLASDSEMFLHIPSSQMEITSEVFVNPYLVEPKKMLMDKKKYTSALSNLSSFFPESGGSDAMFGFLSPVKAYVNNLAIKNLIKNKLIDEEFALDILFVDYKNPLFSKSRCELLSAIENEENWKSQFIHNMKGKVDLVSKELYMNLLVNNKDEYKAIALKYLSDKKLSWQTQEGVTSELKGLHDIRNSVFKDEISQNPRGQILEPGFRIIFPEFKP